MEAGHFYYITDEYFLDFPDVQLMKNKEIVAGKIHDRPCFYALKDDSSDIFWLIPISSQVDKFRKLYDAKMKKYHRCDTIAFGNVLGYKKAFLLQNMCPVTQKYIKNEYKDKDDVPVRIDGVFERELRTKAKRILVLQKKGIKLIFPEVQKIYDKLKSI